MTNGQPITFWSNSFRHISQTSYTNRFCGGTNHLYNTTGGTTVPYWTNHYQLGAEHPTNLNGVVFLGTDDFMSSWGTNTQGFLHANRINGDSCGYTVFMVFAEGANGQAMFSISETNASQDIGEYMCYFLTTYPTAWWQPIPGKNAYANPNSWYQNIPRVWCGTVAAGGTDAAVPYRHLRINSTANFSLSDNAPTGLTNNTNRRLYVGRRNSGGAGEYWVGTLLEMIVYHSGTNSMTEFNKKSIEAYLRKKYNFDYVYPGSSGPL